MQGLTGEPLLDKGAGRRALHQALHRRADLAVARHQQAEIGGQVADKLHVKAKKRQIAHRKRPFLHRLPRQDEDDAGAQVDGVTKDRLQNLEHVPPEAADRLSGRVRQRQSPGPLEDMGQQVLA